MGIRLLNQAKSQTENITHNKILMFQKFIMKKYPTITVGLLRQHLAAYPDDFEIDFSGLSFYRVKTRGENHAQIEFNQSVYLNDEGHVVVENHS